MKKIMTALAIMAFAALSVQAQYVATGTKDVSASALVYSVTNDFGTTYKSLEEIGVQNDTAVTATAVTYKVVGTTLTAINTSSVTAGTTVSAFPMRAVSWGETTNTPYMASKFITTFTLAGTNGAVKAKGVTSYLFVH